jgi:hypothetical protein
MKQHYINKVAELHVSLTKKVKDAFLNVTFPPIDADKEILIEFNEPFVIYQSVWEGDDEVGHIKAPLICKTLRGGEFLGGDDAYNEPFEEIPVLDVEDIMSVAHLLDVVTEGKYKVIDYV